MFNLHNKLVGNVPNVYRDPVTATVIGSVVLGAASSAQAAHQQRKAAKADADRRTAAAQAEQDKADLIASETRPDEQALGDTKFGTGDVNSTGGSTTDFLVPKSNSLGGGTGRSGLGFSI